MIRSSVWSSWSSRLRSVPPSWRTLPQVYAQLHRVLRTLFQRHLHRSDGELPPYDGHPNSRSRFQFSKWPMAEIVLLDQEADDHLGPILRVLGPTESACRRESYLERIQCRGQ